ncbi:SKG3 protein [Plectosphaerella plurivora]|uniref:SKG3 protein n=1 Tax=Plectosphaerella plurivora TaxID=936078 RepID=A0A9P8V8C1_9PEZI|nr:SKG3 protein [Plectosphaerella plurivora]
MSQFSGGNRDSKSPSPASSPTQDSSPFAGAKPNIASLSDHGIHKKPLPPTAHQRAVSASAPPPAVQYPVPSPNPSSSSSAYGDYNAHTPPRPATPSSLDRSGTAAADPYASSPDASPQPLKSASPRANHRRTSSRPLSMVQTYSPPFMDVTEDTIPELQPIFTFLNSHANKLYQEGYFLKLDDQNSHGKPNPDRTWSECFAQLVGTVLSLWDAAELDAAGEDGEVLPKFINLTDASIKMIESLPTRSNDEQPLQNILSISTAGRNRYLLHFNSHHSLVQWTAGIRLAMFEHSTLQEAYTGALIAGKGKTLNNINIVMERSKFPTAEWVRVRFGAGVPWRRCWCVITPPDEKEYQKMQKELRKKAPYNNSKPVLKGDIKFYDTKVEGKKLKKTKPIASITDAYSAYAIYPQAKSLIDASTLLKVEGNITIHSDPPSSTEGFVFIMPEVHPMVSGFEMLLRFLFPTWDTFNLYGRPGRLVASVLDARSLMFAMPKHKRYGYLEILDVNGLITTQGSTTWTEREWRRQLKELTGTRMNTIEDTPPSPDRPAGHGRSSSRKSNRLSFGRSRVGFADDAPAAGPRSSRSLSLSNPNRGQEPQQQRGPPAMAAAMANIAPHHARNSSDPQIPGPDGYRQQGGYDSPARGPGGPPPMRHDDDFARSGGPPPSLEGMRNLQTPEPVQRPPAFNHGPQSRPAAKPYHSPELRRANSRLSNSTLSQLVTAAGAGGAQLPPLPPSHGNNNGPPGGYSDMRSGGHNVAQPSVPTSHANHPMGMHANDDGSREALTSPSANARQPPPFPPPLNTQRSREQVNSPGYGPPRSPLPPHPPSRGGLSPSGDGQMRPPPFANFSRPDGARTPPVGGTPEMRGRPGYGPPSPLPGGQGFFDSRPHTPNAEPVRAPTNTSPPVNRKPVGGPQVQRQFSERSGASSRYDDASSTASPDYASTQRSVEHPSDRPRAGVLRTTGGGEEPSNNTPALDLLDVNFGPTINYGASPRKKTPTPVTQNQQRPYSPAMRAHETAEPDSGPRRVPWHPGGPQAASGPGMSAEQYVQTRAAMGGHSRTPSSQALNHMRSQTPSPSMGRRASQEMLGGHQRRKSSVDLLSSRPGSRGANHALDMAGQGNVGSNLFAREQEQIARMTGGPLVSMGGGRGGPQQAPSGGLVGAIDVRERERQQMKQGVNSQAVQHAINQRQQHQHNMQQQQYHQQQQQQMQYHQQQQQQQAMYQQQNMGRGGGPGPGPYGPPRPHPQQQYGAPMSPGHGAFPRGQPMQGQQMQMPMRQGPPPSPGFMPPQGQFMGGGPRPQSPGGMYGGRGGAPQQQQQQQGRPPYQGQAF